MSAVTFTVAGRGQFPVDMLRYDCAWPQGPEDALHITESYHPDAVFRSWTLTLTSNQSHSPTVARWASFGCTVEVQS